MELLEKDIAELIASINPDFKPSKRFNACPFCGSSDAFGVVKQKRTLFKCFSCGEAGNIIKYASQYWAVSKGEALSRLQGKDFKAIASAKPQPKKEPQYYSKSIAAAYVGQRFSNPLVSLLDKPQRHDVLNKVLLDYYIGTYSDGAVMFWQIDQEYRFHRCKLMYYEADGHRKKVTNSKGKLEGVVSTMRIKLHRSADIEPELCYFGQHLVSLYPNKPVAIVESEKTAIIASVVMPMFNWIATTSKSFFDSQRMLFLRNFKNGIVVYPDHDAYDEWADKIEFLKKVGFQIGISDLIKQQTNNKEDIGDIFLKLL